MSNDIFGISEKAMTLCEERSVMLSNNLVNSSTPHYKARDFDFQKALQDANQNYSLTKTNPHHLSSTNQMGGQELKYRVPMQVSLDGNTVDDEIERKNFMQNALHYQVNLTYVQNKTDELMRAIKGE